MPPNLPLCFRCRHEERKRKEKITFVVIDISSFCNKTISRDGSAAWRQVNAGRSAFKARLCRPAHRNVDHARVTPFVRDALYDSVHNDARVIRRYTFSELRLPRLAGCGNDDRESVRRLCQKHRPTAFIGEPIRGKGCVVGRRPLAQTARERVRRIGRSAPYWPSFNRKQGANR